MTKSRTGLDAAYALKTPDDSVRLYRDWARDYDSGFAAGMNYQLHTHVARAFHAAGGTGPVLDVGAGTGLVGEALAERGIAPVDGLDISPEMLEIAVAKNVYRRTIAADLTRPLAMEDGAYAGIVSAGTFTHGHVGPEALDELLRITRPGGLFALSINAGVYHARGFAARIAALAGTITDPTLIEAAIYGDGADPAHAADTAQIVVFCKL